MFQTIHLKKLLISVGATLGIGFLSGLLTRNQTGIYQTLVKPPLFPPAALFGIVWTVLYICIGIACYLVWDGPATKERDRALGLYAIQLFFNFCWPLIFFGLQWRCFAAIWLLALIVLVFFNMIAFYRLNELAGKLFIPYFVWCLFAAYLNIGICFLN